MSAATFDADPWRVRVRYCSPIQGPLYLIAEHVINPRLPLEALQSADRAPHHAGPPDNSAPETEGVPDGTATATVVATAH
jgi:hypothetical protein